MRVFARVRWSAVLAVLLLAAALVVALVRGSVHDVVLVLAAGAIVAALFSLMEQ